MITQATLFQALADPTRLRILEALRQGECSVHELGKLEAVITATRGEVQS